MHGAYDMIQQFHSLIFTPQIDNVCPLKNLHMNAYWSFIHNCQKLETTKDG